MAMVHGANQALIAFGDGSLCIGREVHRLDVELATDNLLIHELDDTDPPAPYHPYQRFCRIDGRCGIPHRPSHWPVESA